MTDPDDDDDENLGTLLVALMQKERRKKRKEGLDMLTIGYAVYKVYKAVRSVAITITISMTAYIALYSRPLIAPEAILANEHPIHSRLLGKTNDGAGKGSGDRRPIPDWAAPNTVCRL